MLVVFLQSFSFFTCKKLIKFKNIKKTFFRFFFIKTKKLFKETSQMFVNLKKKLICVISRYIFLVLECHFWPMTRNVIIFNYLFPEIKFELKRSQLQKLNKRKNFQQQKCINKQGLIYQH